MNQQDRKHDPTDEDKSLCKSRMREKVLQGWLIEEIKEDAEKEFNITGQASGRYMKEVLEEFRDTAKTDQVQNLSIQQKRYESFLKELLKTPAEQRDHKTWRIILDLMKNLDKILGIEGPKAINNIQLNLNQQNNSGLEAAYPVSTDKSEAELLRDAKQRGLPVPQQSLDEELQRTAQEAGANGEKVVISKEDAQSLVQGSRSVSTDR